MNYYLKNRLLKTVAFLTVISAQPVIALEIESDFDYLVSPKTTIKGLHRLFVGVPVSDTLSFGQSIYSGASGDGGKNGYAALQKRDGAAGRWSYQHAMKQRARQQALAW